jgi:tRNA A37 threonylcarbamoyladenosine synthetase subunit TsaC/SUA5/YrdC
VYTGLIAATSANITGDETLTNVQEILVVFGNQIDYIIQPITDFTKQSTIIECIDQKIRLIRAGCIPFEQILDSV